MKDMERQEFERDLRDAFRDAEVSPSDRLWTNIELDLEKAEGGEMKKRLFYYKLMAAASITFAICVAGAAVYFYSQQTKVNALALTGGQAVEQVIPKITNSDAPGTLTNESLKSKSVTEELNIMAHTDEERLTKSTLSTENDAIQNNSRLATAGAHSNTQLPDDNSRSNKRLNHKSSITSDQSNIALNESYRTEHAGQLTSQPEAIKFTSDGDRVSRTNEVNSNASVTEKADDIRYANNTAAQERSDPREFFNKKLNPFAYTERVTLNRHEEQQDPVAIMMAKLQARESELMNAEDNTKKKKDTKDVTGEKVWTALAVAAGANTSASRPGNTPDNIYSLGLGVGTKVTNRWVVQGGINYLTQLSSGQASEVLTADALSTFRVASTTESSNLKDNKGSNQSQQLVGTAKYDANSQAQFISVPVQAGYLAVNRKFGLLVNAGIATNLFIRNTITPESDMIKKSSQNVGEKESDYNPVNFNGLFNTEISYKLGKRYRLALNPGLRYPFGSAYKSAAKITSTPLTMDVGLKFRYIFQ